MLFKAEEEVILAGPYSRVGLLFTDRDKGKWVDSQITGQVTLVLLKDVGAPITVIRVATESEDSQEVGQVVFEYEVPLNCQMERIQSNFTSIKLLDKGQYVGFLFKKSVADCTMFNMRL